MKISFQKTDILESVQRAQTVITAKTPLTILANVVIEAVDGQVILTATDLQVGIKCKAPAKVSEPGATTIPARLLSSILRELPGEDIHFSTDAKDITTITCGRSFFKMMGLSKEEYPKQAEFPEEEAFTIEQKTLSGMLKKCVYSISREDSRYALMGLYFLLKDKKLTLVSTDGRRLSKVDAPIDIDNKYKKDFILPLKAVEELTRLLRTEGEAKVFIEKSNVAFDLEHTRLSARLIDGVFPDYERVIPESSQTKIKLPREEFTSLIRMVSTMTSDQSNMVRLKFEKEKLTLSTQTKEVGEARADMPIDYKGADLEVGFNPIFFRDALASIEDEEVTLELGDAQSPGVIRDDGSFIHVIMPMRLHDLVDNE